MLRNWPLTLYRTSFWKIPPWKSRRLHRCRSPRKSLAMEISSTQLGRMKILIVNIRILPWHVLMRKEKRQTIIGKLLGYRILAAKRKRSMGPTLYPENMASGNHHFHKKRTTWKVMRKCRQSTLFAYHRNVIIVTYPLNIIFPRTRTMLSPMKLGEVRMERNTMVLRMGSRTTMGGRQVCSLNLASLERHRVTKYRKRSPLSSSKKRRRINP